MFFESGFNLRDLCGFLLGAVFASVDGDPKKAMCIEERNDESLPTGWKPCSKYKHNLELLKSSRR